ncbi:hypothetical protein Adt_22942 [Abeliophyllum distichum]|uniref:Uncharacterized protein n=1 Tax=Abeliophyllum distichum TaxID=126358 RepID=A0ABD1SCG7_9LAMI
MADVMSHEGDNHPRVSNGVSLEALTSRRFGKENGKRPLSIAFNNVEHTMQPIKNNAKYFTRLVGNQVRFTVPSCYPSWTEVPEEQWARLRSIIEVRETQQIQVTSSGASIDERAIAKEVLRERRGHVCGVRRVPKGTSPSFDSTAASNTPRRTSNQFSGDP